MELEGSLPYSQQPASESYPDSGEPIPQLPAIFF
jgi:hypothetical protein